MHHRLLRFVPARVRVMPVFLSLSMVGMYVPTLFYPQGWRGYSIHTKGYFIRQMVFFKSGIHMACTSRVNSNVGGRWTVVVVAVVGVAVTPLPPSFMLSHFPCNAGSTFTRVSTYVRVCTYTGTGWLDVPRNRGLATS